MRYYKIEVDGGKTYSSFEGNKNLPGALQVQLDIPVAPASAPQGIAMVRVYGVSLDEVSQASNNNNKNIKVYGGMQRGLPLAKPQQSGLLLKGYVFQCLGNWIGTDQYIDFYIAPGTAPTGQATKTTPKNIVLDWKKNSTLSAPLKSALSTAFPGFDIEVNISDKLKLPGDEQGFYGTIQQFGAYLKQATKAIIGGDYLGVDLVMTEKKILAYDGSTPSSSVTNIDYVDLIGQPTWIDAPNIQFKTVMRADLEIGGSVKLPQGQTFNTPGAQTSLLNQKLAFQGEFQIAVMRHLGDFRQETADAWVTVFTAFPKQTAAAS